MSCPSNTFTKSFDFSEDRIGTRIPHEGFGVGVVVFHETIDVVDEISDAAEGSSPNRPLGASHKLLLVKI